jgi:tRNA(Arg) A34 adenosine deaminase TadA
MDRKFMEEATRLAIESVEKGWGGPFGAVIVKDGEIIGRGQNRVLLTGCPVFHAEITAIIDASSRLNPKILLGSDYHAGTILEMIARPPGSPDLVPERARMLKGCEIYINGAPCPMCMSAIYWSRIDHALFRLQPGGYESHRLLRCFPVRRLRAAVGTAAGHQGDAKFRT